ncbi:21458_t:CDS:1, partial [Gigaspora rosea]
EVKELDKCTSELQKISQEIYELMESMLLKKSTRLTSEYLQDFLEMAFCSRLEKMRNTMEYGYCSYTKAIETIKEV